MKVPPMILIFLGVVLASTAALADEGKIAKNTLIVETHADAPALPKLTDEQLDKIHAIKMKYADAGAARMTELHKFHKKLFDDLSLVNVDKNEVLSLQNKITALEGQAANERVEMMIELHDVLSSEQRLQIRRRILVHDLAGFGPGLGMPPQGMPSGLLGMPPGFGFEVPGLPPPPGPPVDGLFRVGPMPLPSCNP